MRNECAWHLGWIVIICCGQLVAGQGSAEEVARRNQMSRFADLLQKYSAMLTNTPRYTLFGTKDQFLTDLPAQTGDQIGYLLKIIAERSLSETEALASPSLDTIGGIGENTKCFIQIRAVQTAFNQQGLGGSNYGGTGSYGTSNSSYGSNSQYGGSQYGSQQGGTGQSGTGSQYGTGTQTGTGSQYGTGSQPGTGGQYGTGSQYGTSGQYGAGTQTGQFGGKTLFANNARVERVEQTSNGYLYVLDRALAVAKYKSLEDLMTSEESTNLEQFNNQLFSRLPGPDHTKYRNKKGKYTFFIPSDTAFRDLGTKFEQMLNDPMQKEQLYKLVKAHVHSDTDKVFFKAAMLNGESYTSDNPDMQIVVSVVPSSTAGGEPDVYVSSGHVRGKIIQGDIALLNGVAHIVDQVLSYPTLTVDRILQRDFSRFYELIQYAPSDVRQALQRDPMQGGAQTVTVLAPTNEFFNSIPADQMQQLRGNTSALEQMFRLHVITSNEPIFTSHDRSVFQRGTAYQTMANQAVTAEVNELPNPNGDGPTVREVTIYRQNDRSKSVVIATELADSRGNNGVVHGVRGTLVTTLRGGSILSTLRASGQFSQFIRGIEASMLQSTLENPTGKMTLFAPTDAAIQRYGMAPWNDLVTKATRREEESYALLRQIVMRHLIDRDEIRSSSLEDGARLTRRSEGGITLTVERRTGTLFVEALLRDERVNARVERETPAGNGVVLQISDVLISRQDPKKGFTSASSALRLAWMGPALAALLHLV